MMILCCGEALIDMVPAATASGRQGYVPHEGGAIFNTAIALGRLGLKAGILTGISRDFLGEALLSSLRANRVDTSLVVRSERPTTLAFVNLQNGGACYTFYDENSAGRMLVEDDIPKVPDNVGTMVFGGISLIGEPAATTLVQLARREAGRRVIMLDPNIRSVMIRDGNRHRARMRELIALADIVKVSDEDLDWLVPGDGSRSSKCESLFRSGPSVVILTRGAAGARARFGRGDTATVPASLVDVVDTIGAGDTFNAGVLAHLADNRLLTRERLADIDANSMREALSLGARAAAITVSRPGADPPWRHELAHSRSEDG